MKPKTKKILTWTISLFVGLPILAVCFLFVFIYMIGGSKEHPTDEMLIAQLSDNKSGYEQLITMFKTDQPISIVAPTWQSPEGQLNEKRWSEYKGIFEELNIDMGMRKWGGKAIWFLNSTRGMAIGGDTKGLMYKPINPTPIYSSLNERPKDLESGVMAYKKINDSWYITFDWND